jgi:hypothetical protein
MSSKFFSSRNEPKQNPKVTTKNAPGSRTNVKKNNGIRKTGRGN